MRVISKRPLQAWYEDALRAQWQTPAEIKRSYGNTSLLGDNRVVFNIKGNDYRLVVKVHYDRKHVYIRFVGTHRAYDEIDARTI